MRERASKFVHINPPPRFFLPGCAPALGRAKGRQVSPSDMENFCQMLTHAMVHSMHVSAVAKSTRHGLFRHMEGHEEEAVCALHHRRQNPLHEATA